MKQDKKVVKVILKKEIEEDVLKFCFEKEIFINLLNADNSSLKEVFKTILDELIKDNFSFELEIEDGYDVGLFKDVAKEYINGFI